MGANSKIEWCHHTLNPWRGCTKVTWTDGEGKTRLHSGCVACYAEVDMSVKLHGIKWGKGQTRVPKAESGWKEPLRWARAAAKAGERHRVFCASLADVLDSEVPDSMRERLWDTIRQTACMSASNQRPHALTSAERNHNVFHHHPGLDWLLLTKRPENWRLVPEDVRPLVWLGTSISDQTTADEWVPRLLDAHGFQYRFLSAEPLVGPVDLSRFFAQGGDVWPHHLDWVIVGGESGPRARPCNVEWIRSIVRQCAEAGTPCHVKQLGADARVPREPGDAWGDKALPLKDSKGGDWDEWPEDLRVRQFPGGAP